MLFDDVQKFGIRSSEIRFENKLLENKTPEGVISRFIYKLGDLHLIEPGGNLSSGLIEKNQRVDVLLALSVSTPNMSAKRLKSPKANILACQLLACMGAKQIAPLQMSTSCYPLDFHPTQAFNFRRAAGVGQMLNLRFDRFVRLIARRANTRDGNHATKDRRVQGGEGS
jgi:hypothetical protein